MNQTERRIYLIQKLLAEQPEYRDTQIPADEIQQRQLLRGLMNIRMPGETDEEFCKVQDAYLQEELKRKGVVRIDSIAFNQEGLGFWKGDITRLAADAIVNAANSGMTGCYVPNHTCIDNCIHTYAGIQLRCECGKIMAGQGYAEPAGQAKITPGYNLPCRYVIHTVGPIVRGRVTKQDEELLASCYRSCLALAAANHIESIAFCCVSTGVFHFPNRRAAEIAVRTVKDCLKEETSVKKVIFNVFKDIDEQIYRELLG
jgi:O-acetyl-ADP-ribose deacetylase (regulator of RNase III)